MMDGRNAAGIILLFGYGVTCVGLGMLFARALLRKESARLQAIIGQKDRAYTLLMVQHQAAHDALCDICFHRLDSIPTDAPVGADALAEAMTRRARAYMQVKQHRAGSREVGDKPV